MGNFQGDGEFRSKRRTKTERRSNASFGLTYVEVFHLVLARSTCHSAYLLTPQCLSAEPPQQGRDGCKGGSGYHEIDSRKPMPPTPPLIEAEQLDFPDGKNTFAATLPHCRGKLGLKHLELTTACDAFQESRGQPRVVVRPRSAAHGTSGGLIIISSCRRGRKQPASRDPTQAGRLGRSDKSRRASGHPSPLGWDFGSAGCQMRRFGGSCHPLFDLCRSGRDSFDLFWRRPH
jgi:hypothetical protein